MDLPLVLSLRRDGVLVYRIPIWYRVAMAVIFAAVASALLLGGQAPSAIGWIIMVILLLALLYEESWFFDRARGEIRHRFGLLIAARKLVFRMDGLGCFRLVPWVRGSLPGSAEEKADNRETLEASRGKQVLGLDSKGKKRPIYRKPYLTLMGEAEEATFTINMVPARRAVALRAVAEKIAAQCGKPLEEG